MKKFLILLVGLMLAACTTTYSNDAVASKTTQKDVMSRAMKAVPAYVPSNFPARESINRYLKETEFTTDWYIYALNMMGEPLFYIVSDSKPMNICISITAPDRREYGGSGAVALSAPALDGVYYGGAHCNAYYMFDAGTGSMIELAGNTFTLISSKVPLYLETDVARLQPTE